MTWSDYTIGGTIILFLLLVAGWFIHKVKESARIGARSGPLSNDDRLRVSLALTAMESAEKELAKAMWRDLQRPGHPQVGELLYQVMDLRYRIQRLLREL